MVGLLPLAAIPLLIIGAAAQVPGMLPVLGAFPFLFGGWSGAAELADEVGLDRLTLAAPAARLGGRQPSLYHHVVSLKALRRLISMRAKAELADVLGRAAIGRARDDALIATAHAWRAWALAHPGRYQAAERGSAPATSSTGGSRTRPSRC